MLQKNKDLPLSTKETHLNILAQIGLGKEADFQRLFRFSNIPLMFTFHSAVNLQLLKAS